MRVLLENVNCAVLRSAVYDDVLKVWVLLCDDALNAAANELATVVSRRDDRNFGPTRHGASFREYTGTAVVRCGCDSGWCMSVRGPGRAGVDLTSRGHYRRYELKT